MSCVRLEFAVGIAFVSGCFAEPSNLDDILGTGGEGGTSATTVGTGVEPGPGEASSSGDGPRDADAGQSSDSTSGPGTSDTPAEESTGGALPACGDGNVDPGELCLAEFPDLRTVAYGAFEVAVADFNGNGSDDIASLGEGVVSVLLGAGDGTWEDATYYTATTNAYSMQAADGDGNGWPDLVLLGDEIATLTNGGDGYFYKLSWASGSGGSRSNNLAVLDADGDAYLDVIYGKDYSYHLQQGYNSTGAWGLFTSEQLQVPAAEGATGVIVTELTSDEDDATDLVLLNRWYPTAAIMAGTGGTQFQHVADVEVCPAPSPYGARHGVAGDLDGDGNIDLIASCYYEDATSAQLAQTMLILGADDGSFLSPQVIALGGAHRPYLHDVDADGYLDIVLAMPDGLRIYRRVDGRVGVTHVPTPAPVYSVAFGDIDGDGAVDIVTAFEGSTHEGGRVAIWRGQP